MSLSPRENEALWLPKLQKFSDFSVEHSQGRAFKARPFLHGGKMRIYFAGSHSVGKTTLARYTAGKYSLPLLNEVARTILTEKELKLESLRIDLDIVDDYQKSILLRQIEEEKRYTDFVSDRTLDCLAYAAQHSRIFSTLMRSQELEKYIVSLKQKDVRIFFVRPSRNTMQNDGVRESVNWDGIVAIDAIVKCLLEQFDLKYTIIASDSMQERVRIIDSIVNVSKD